MNKRFASFLLTGKVATFSPFMANSAFAQLTSIPGSDLLSSDLHLIEEPGGAVTLISTTTAAPDATGYTGGDAACITNSLTSASPTTMNLVVTGVRNGDIVFIIASRDKDYAPFQSIHPQARLGNTGRVVLAAVRVSLTSISNATAGGQLASSRSAISIPIDLTAPAVSALLQGSSFYIQAAALPPNTANFGLARVSELDQITVSATGCGSTYGGTTY